ncbi:MAG: DUF116 domain-containing protein [Deltaproteobacteria bacterium]|nr:DUF116 domain-containing protein [Deltaproteobacteria bacterium]
MQFRLLDPGPLSAAANMALDEILTRRAGAGESPPTLRFLQFSPDAALVGYHQETARELRLDYCREVGIDLNRRLTGGGAILFQGSALGWELVAPLGQPPFRGGFEDSLTAICQTAARGLARLGLAASFRPRNDIEVEGRKVSGTGGFVLDGGALFQGTVLVRNEIERFLYALRVPVEKLKKREISSLMDRMAFLEDLLGRELPVSELKDALAAEFTASLGLELAPGGLTAAEEAELAARLPYFQSEEWVHGQRAPSVRPAWLRHILATDQGTVSVNLWLDRRGQRVQKALFSGDFFSRPQRLVRDLEAALLGRKADAAGLAAFTREFLAGQDGGFLGISPEELAGAVGRAAARQDLARLFSPLEASELFLVGLEPTALGRRPASWLLLPYCSKPVDCDFRKVPDCGRCGECQFADLYQLSGELGLAPVSIQSFEHLHAVLQDLAGRGESFVGSCCEAFFCKHQREMLATGAQGVLVNLDSTTCYDLGKGMEAYVGRFDHQTSMNTELLGKVARVMARA